MTTTHRAAVTRAALSALASLAGLAMLILPCVAMAGDTQAFSGPTLGPVPVEFLLFACVLAGVALFHQHTLRTAVVGVVVITLYKLLWSPEQGTKHCRNGDDCSAKTIFY